MLACRLVDATESLKMYGNSISIIRKVARPCGRRFAPLMLLLAACSREQGTHALDLSERRVYQVPDGFDLTGIAPLHSQEGVLAWGAIEPVVLRLSQAGNARIDYASNLAPVGVAALPGGSLEVVVPVDPMLLHIDSSGRTTERLTLRLVDLTAREAIRSVGRWFIAATDSSGDLHVLFIGGTPLHPREVFSVTRKSVLSLLPSPHAQVSVKLTPHPRGVAVTLLWRPFSTVVVDSSGTHLAHLDPTALLRREGVDPKRHLASLGASYFGEGYLQTVTDLGSDDRWLLLFGRDGAPVRIRHVDAPIGIVSYSLQSGTFFAVRRSRGSVIVEYGWRWGGQTYH